MKRTPDLTKPKKHGRLSACCLLLGWFFAAPGSAADDSRQMVELPKPMQTHMLSNMRDHLNALNEILLAMSNGDLDQAAAIAEHRLGMSSLASHHASRMAPYMPTAMRETGTSMHHAASRFALKAEEGEPAEAYQALTAVTQACVRCHSAYRIR